jgi:hypothetical protein
MLAQKLSSSKPFQSSSEDGDEGDKLEGCVRVLRVDGEIERCGKGMMEGSVRIAGPGNRR